MSKLLITRVFNPAHQRANELRGSLALEALMRYTILGRVMEVCSPEPNGLTKFSSNGVVFFDLATAFNSMEFAERILEDYKRVIVDVHFPVKDPSHAWAAGPDGVIQEDATHQVIEFWSRPDVQSWVNGFLYRVPAITTPHMQTYRKLKGLNPNIFLLPDVTSKRAALRFCKQFCRAIEASQQSDASTLQRIGNWLRFTIGWPALIRELREHLDEAVGR